MDFILLLFVFLLSWITTRIMMKKLHISKKALSEYVTPNHKGIEILIGIVLTIILVLLDVSMGMGFISAYSFVPMFLIFNTLRGYLQWKHDKESKHYAISFTEAGFLFYLLIGLIIILIPREFEETYDSILYEEYDENIVGDIEIKFDGILKHNVLYGKIFDGDIYINGLKYSANLLGSKDYTPFFARNDNRYYGLLQENGREVKVINFWTNDDLSAFAGEFDNHIFAYPAKTYEDATTLLNNLMENEEVEIEHLNKSETSIDK